MQAVSGQNMGCVNLSQAFDRQHWLLLTIAAGDIFYSPFQFVL